MVRTVGRIPRQNREEIAKRERSHDNDEPDRKAAGTKVEDGHPFEGKGNGLKSTNGAFRVKRPTRYSKRKIMEKKEKNARSLGIEKNSTADREMRLRKGR